ncbi:hypothetical protein LSTR_LSTR004843 [Laodelphax striatellus]|uniref:Uncharacterized protein n=1 Tax=Laodelphax striatellus TaxID=195883 RepID=A0A482WI17_LAOST|nr:hypothetical protein LSTR_LSTR004843 [Laodelphax striatellus]
MGNGSQETQTLFWTSKDRRDQKTEGTIEKKIGIDKIEETIDQRPKRQLRKRLEYDKEKNVQEDKRDKDGNDILSGDDLLTELLDLDNSDIDDKSDDDDCIHPSFDNAEQLRQLLTDSGPDDSDEDPTFEPGLGEDDDDDDDDEPTSQRKRKKTTPKTNRKPPKKCNKGPDWKATFGRIHQNMAHQNPARDKPCKTRVCPNKKIHVNKLPPPDCPPCARQQYP